MARNTKCPSCGLFFDRDQIPFIHVKNRYWHKSCWDAENAKAAQSELDLKALEEYVMKLFKLDYIDARIRKQMKDMMASYSFTYSGIHKTLIYWYEIKKNSIEKANGGLGIVPYVYKDAAKYFYTVFMAQQQNKDKDTSQFVKKGRTIRITPPERKVKPIRIIDLDALEEVENGE
jgi:hypothetical protein